MLHVDLDLIAPSSRDLLRAVSTRRRSVALVAAVPEHDDAAQGETAASDEVARLEDLGVSALGFTEVSAAMRAGALAVRTAPILGLHAVEDREALRRARYCGADGVCIPPTGDAWDVVAPQARMLRMSPIALVTSEPEARRAAELGARAALVRGGGVPEVLQLVRELPRRMVVVAEVAGADVGTLRSLRGEVDAAIVPRALHAGPNFEDVVAEVDP